MFAVIGWLLISVASSQMCAAPTVDLPWEISAKCHVLPNDATATEITFKGSGPEETLAVFSRTREEAWFVGARDGRTVIVPNVQKHMYVASTATLYSVFVEDCPIQQWDGWGEDGRFIFLPFAAGGSVAGLAIE